MTEDFEAVRALLAECVWNDYLHVYNAERIDAWRDRALDLLERYGWKMTHLRELETIAFDLDHMLPLIQRGTPSVDEYGTVTWKDSHSGVLGFGLWLATVPEPYRAIAERGVVSIFEERRNEKLDDRARRQFVIQLATYCYPRVRDARNAAE